MSKLKHVDSERIGDELFVRDLLDRMEGQNNYAKAGAVVDGLRKRMRDRFREDMRMKAEREKGADHA
jgi:hypothetical protein